MPIVVVIIAVVSIFAWLTSLGYLVANSKWMAAVIIHIFLSPLGVTHGFFVWFGASWF